ncbi:MAG: VanZ family protein [Clostridia bacterium]|nr:VanZ family protein [Clostridia bacterium]
MPAFLTCALVLGAYLMSVLALGSAKTLRASTAQLCVFLAPVALIVLATLALCAMSAGSWDDMLMLMAVLSPAAAAGLGIRGLGRWRSSLSRGMTALFLLSLLAVGYVTLFSRDGSTSTRVLFGLRNITKAFRTGTLLPLKHLFMNILLFMPFGFLLSACCPGRSDSLAVVFTYALVFCCAIEALQYLLVIGECDLEDVLGNMLGACAGLGVYRAYLNLR